MTVQYIVFDPEGLAEKQNQAVKSWYRGREYGSCRVLRWDRLLVYKKTKGCRVLGGVQSTSVVVQNTGVVCQKRSRTIPKMIVCKTRNGRGQIGTD